MNLTIDIGNSFIKTVIFYDTAPVFRNVSGLLTSKYINRLLHQFPIENAMISSVVKINKSTFTSLKSLQHFEILSDTSSIPIKNCYETPSTLGNDRLANAIAGAFLFPGNNVLIIDAGTCIKYDFVNARKVYLGGSISPGMEMRFKAMHRFTGQLPLIKTIDKAMLTGRSTIEALQSGVGIGVVEELLGFIQRYKKKYKSLKIILTGGDSVRFARDLNLSIFAAEDLVNIGLNEIIRFNTVKKARK